VRLEDERNHRVEEAAGKAPVAPLDEGGVLRFAIDIALLLALLIKDRSCRQRGKEAVLPARIGISLIRRPIESSTLANPSNLPFSIGRKSSNCVRCRSGRPPKPIAVAASVARILLS
jgi:hypothetical protein